jgi:hypothetical protein
LATHRRDPTPAESDVSAVRRFFFIHVMKTAGTTFALQLQQQFHGAEIYPSGDIDQGETNNPQVYVSARRLLELPPERRALIRIYSGHFPYVASEVVGGNVVTLTLLRDPVSRTISVLKHFKRLHERYHEQRLEEIYEDEFIYSHFIDNHQTLIFSVERADNPDAFSSSLSYDATLDALSPARDPKVLSATRSSRIVVDDRRLAIAMGNLARTDVVGLTSGYAEFVEELRNRFGWWPGGVDAGARANASSEPWDVPSSLRARIAADNVYDVELYRHAEGLVAQRRESSPFEAIPGPAIIHRAREVRPPGARGDG